MPRRPPVILSYAGHRNGGRVRLTARVFRHAPAPLEHGGRRQRLASLWSIWGTHEWPNAGVAVAGDGFQGQARADREGFVRFDLDCDRPLPEHARWERARVWLPDHAHVPVVRAPILAPGRDGRLGVISDLDDTLLVTGRIGPRNWRRLLWQGPTERQPVPGAAALFEALAARSPTAAQLAGAWPARLGADPAGASEPAAVAPARPFFYVSSSPWNLHGYLSQFLAHHGFPAGVFALRDWGANRATFGTGGHGAHKSERIAELLDFHPELRFVLIGDDSQGDVLAYAAAVAAHPDRVAGVFLRSTGPASLSAAEDSAIADLRAGGTPVFVGPAWDAGLRMVEELGLRPAEPSAIPPAARSS